MVFVLDVQFNVTICLVKEIKKKNVTIVLFTCTKPFELVILGLAAPCIFISLFNTTISMTSIWPQNHVQQYSNRVVFNIQKFVHYFKEIYLF